MELQWQGKREPKKTALVQAILNEYQPENVEDMLIKSTIKAFITFQGTLSSWWTKIIIAVLLCFFLVLQSLFAAAKKK